AYRLARRRPRGGGRPGRAHHRREHGERAQRRPPRRRARGRRRDVVLACAAREGRPALAPAPHRDQGALGLAARKVAVGVAAGAGALAAPAVPALGRRAEELGAVMQGIRLEVGHLNAPGRSGGAYPTSTWMRCFASRSGPPGRWARTASTSERIESAVSA